MPIEFKCENCQTILRTPDNSAGKSARCPGCSNVQPIPAKYSDLDVDIPDAIPVGNSVHQNPYARPSASAGPAGNPYTPAGVPTEMNASTAKLRTQPAAITWLVVSILVSLFLLLGVVVMTAELVSGQGLAEDIVALIGTGSFLILSLMGVVGSILMLRMRARKLAIACAICSMIPGSMCCFLSTGVSVWSLVVLLDGDIKPHFH